MNCLFIGLGGSGTTTLALLNKMLDEHYIFLQASNNQQETFDSLLKDEYLYVDTDFTVKNRFKLENDDFCNMGVWSPNTILTEIKRDSFENVARKKRVLEWADSAEIAINGAKSLEAGADGLRMLSRMNLFQEINGNHEGSLYKKLKYKIQVLQDRQNRFNEVNNAHLKIRIYIIGGSCGGTGSGIYLDLLYLIHSLYKTEANLIGMDQPDVRPIIIMPHGYIANVDEGPKKSNYKLNAYAFFQELNAVVKNFYSGNFETSAFNDYSVIPTGIVNDASNKFNPFRFACLYDTISQSPTASFDESSKQLANFIFQLEVTSSDMDENFSNSFDSSITNDYIPIARASVNNEYIDAFLVPGYFSIVKSDEFLKSYVRKRLTHEVFKYGILGSQIQSLTAEERQYVVNTYEEFLTKRINDFKERLTPDLVALCGRSKHDILPFSQDLENLANGNNLKSEYKPINKAIHDFFGELTNETYKFIFDFFQDFNLRFAFEAFIILDNHYTKFVPNANSNKKDFIEKNFKKSIFFTENDSISFRNQIIDNYFEFYFTTNLYNLLTKGNEGVLDNCSAFLTKLIGKIQYKDNWEVEFKLQVQVAKKDLSKIYIPELKEIVNDKSEIVKNNSFEKQYCKILLRQSKSSEPLINERINASTGEDSNALVTSSYSIRKIKEEIFKNIELLKNYFEPDGERVKLDTFAGIIFGHLNSWVINQVENNPHISSITSKSISQLLKKENTDGLTNAEYTSIVNRFRNKKDVQFQKRNNVTDNPAFTVIFGNFEDNESLQHDLGAEETVLNRMNLKVFKNAVGNDRIVKLRLEYRYNLNDYVFYEQDYVIFFEQNFQSLGSNYVHQPFIHKKFIGENYDGKVWNIFLKHLNAIDLKVEESGHFSDSDILRFTLFFLYVFGQQLKIQNAITEDIANGFSFDASSQMIKISTCEYDEWEKTYSLNKSIQPIFIDITKTIDPNGIAMVNKTLVSWINLIIAKKSEIADEFTILNDARKLSVSNQIPVNSDFLQIFADPSSKTIKRDILQFYKAKFKL